MGSIESNRAFGGVGGKQQRPHPETYSSARINPPITFKAPWRVIGLEIIGDRELYVWFVDGTAGRVKFMPSFFEKEVFAHLADPVFFEEVDVRYGTVIWPGNIDLAPDAMHEAIQAHGEWVLQ
jgi:hypothetical protein